MKISKNLKIILYIFSVLIVVCLVLLLGNHLPILAKGAIITMSWLPTYLACTMLSVLSKSTYQKKEKNMFGITAKLYTVLVLLSSSIYTIGVWLLTPDSLIKNIMLGIGLSVQLLLMFYFLFKRINEEPDERFYRNIAKSSSILFTIAIFILLLIATLIAVGGVFILNAGFLYILVAFLLLLFAITYFIIEKRGWNMAKESKIETNLKKVREAYGMTQQDLADQVGIRRETIVHLENNRYNPSLEMALKIAQVFNKQVEELFHLK